MFCPNCGTKNEDDAAFCVNCGTPIAQFQSSDTQDNALAQPEGNVKTAEAQPQIAAETAEAQPEVAAETAEAQPEVAAEIAEAQPEIAVETVEAQSEMATETVDQSEEMTETILNQGEQAQAGDYQQYQNGYYQQEQDANVQQTQQNAPAQAQPKAPKKPKKPFKLTKQMIAIGSGALAVLIAIVVFIIVGSAGANYKNTAKKYAQAYLKCDWDTAYGMVNIPVNEFLTKDAYKTVNKEATPKDVAAMTVTDTALYNYLLGASGKNTIGKTVIVSYSVPGSSKTDMTVTLDVSPKKRMLFFKQYKVSSDSIISSDISVNVPAGAKFTINGVEVNDTYKTTSSSKTQDTYKIPYLFNGSNVVKVTGDFFEDYETTFSVSYKGESFSISSSKLKMKEDVVKALQTQAETDLKAIADACLANKEVSTINSRIYSDALTNVTKCYGYSLQDCHSTSKDIKTLTLSNIKTSIKSTSVTYDSDDGYPTAQVSLGFSKSGTYSYKSSASTTKNGTGTESSDYIRYKYINGTWMIYYFSIDLGIS